MPRTSLTMRDRDAGEEIVREPRPVGGHAVEALDRADGRRIFVGPRVAHDADALHRQQHRKALPERSYSPRARISSATIVSARRSRSSAHA